MLLDVFELVLRGEAKRVVSGEEDQASAVHQLMRYIPAPICRKYCGGAKFEDACGLQLSSL